MKKYMRNNRTLLFLLMVTSAVYGALNATVPIVAGMIIDYDTTTGQNLFYYYELKGLCLMSLIIFACTIVSGLLKVFVKTKYICKVRKEIEKDVACAAMRSRISSSSLINMFCTEVDIIIDGYFSNHGELVSVIVPFVIALGYSLAMSWLSIVIIVACFCVLLLLNQVLLAPMSRFMVSLSKSNESVNKILLGFLNVVTSLKIYGGIDYAFRHIQDVLIERNKVESDKAKYEVFVEGINCLFSTLLQLIPLAIIAIMVVNGKLTIGVALSIMLLFEKIVSPIDKVSTIREKYAESKAYRNKIEGFTSANLEPKNDAVCGIRKEADNQLNVQDLYITIDDKPIIKDFSAIFEFKKKYLVIGRNGTGKSTLLKVLTKQIDDYYGNICLFGRELKDFSSCELFETVGIIPQNPEIFEDTVYNNITLGKPAGRTQVLEALKLAGLPKDRLQEKVKENWNNFSGGELQRIILARMFCNPKQIYCLDEVVSGLQYNLAKTIENTIINHSNATIINVSHRTDTATMQKYDAVINMNLANKNHLEA